MPTKVIFFKETDGTVPFLDWLRDLKEKKAVAKCIAMVELLEQFGPKLRRPHADILRDGIHELRTRVGRVQYRLLYFFHEQLAVISHGFIKPGAKVEAKEIDRAVGNREVFRKAPNEHTFQEGLDHDQK
jgi:hypothetical protein